MHQATRVRKVGPNYSKRTTKTARGRIVLASMRHRDGYSNGHGCRQGPQEPTCQIIIHAYTIRANLKHTRKQPRRMLKTGTMQNLSQCLYINR